MRFAFRPYLIAGAALGGAAGIVAMAPAGPNLPDVKVPAVQPAGSEHYDINMQDFLGTLANSDGWLPLPEVVPGPDETSPPAVLPDPGVLPDPALAPPDLGRLDLSGTGLGVVPGPGTLPNLFTFGVPTGQ